MKRQILRNAVRVAWTSSVICLSILLASMHHVGTVSSVTNNENWAVIRQVAVGTDASV